MHFRRRNIMHKVAIITILLIIGAAIGATLYSYVILIPYTYPLDIENLEFIREAESEKIKITIRNTEIKAITVGAVYVGLNSSNLEKQENVYLGTVHALSTLTITILNYDFEGGRTYWFEIQTEERGHFGFSRRCSSITVPVIETEQPEKPEPFPLTIVTKILARYA